MTALVSFSFAIIKIPDKNNLEEEKFIWAHSFRRFSPWSADSKAETSWLKGIVEESCSAHDSRENREERKGSGLDKSFWGTPPVTYFFQLGPTFLWSIQLSMVQSSKHLIVLGIMLPTHEPLGTFQIQTITMTTQVGA